MVEKPVVLGFRIDPVLPFNMLVPLHSSPACLSRGCRKERQPEPSLAVGPWESRQSRPPSWREGHPLLCGSIRVVRTETPLLFPPWRRGHFWCILCVGSFFPTRLICPLLCSLLIMLPCPSLVSSASKKTCRSSGRYCIGEAIFQSLTTSLSNSAF